MSRPDRAAASLTSDYFEALYAGDPDPWRFETSPYESDKYAATVAALPNPHYGRALEVGCSLGVLTRLLAPRCRELLAVDVVEKALARARQRCRDLPHVAFARMRVPDELPGGAFDLVLLSEVVYYWDLADVARVAAFLEVALRPEGDLLLVHWTGETDYPLSGDDAAERLLAAVAGFTRPLLRERREGYRLDLSRRSWPPGASGP